MGNTERSKQWPQTDRSDLFCTDFGATPRVHGIVVFDIGMKNATWQSLFHSLEKN